MGGYSPSYHDGQWKCICDVSGRIVLSSRIKRRWDNALVHPDHWETRQPQDYITGVKDNLAVLFSRPDTDHSILTEGEVLPFPGDGVPVATTSLLAVSLIIAEVNLTWVDNSLDEIKFIIERKLTNQPSNPELDGHLSSIASVPADITLFTDIDVVSGQSYDYQVSAFNANGLSSPSNRVTVVVL